MPLKVFWLSTEFLFILHFLVKVKFTDIALYLGLAFKIDAEEAPLEGGWGRLLWFILLGLGGWVSLSSIVSLWNRQESRDQCVYVCNACACERKEFVKECLRQQWNKLEKIKEEKLKLKLIRSVYIKRVGNIWCGYMMKLIKINLISGNDRM